MIVIRIPGKMIIDSGLIVISGSRFSEHDHDDPGTFCTGARKRWTSQKASCSPQETEGETACQPGDCPCARSRKYSASASSWGWGNGRSPELVRSVRQRC